MSQPTFTVSDVEFPAPHGPARLVRIDIPGGVTSPAEFAEAVAGQSHLFVAPGRGVVFSGRAPVWGFAMLCHIAHPSPWIATIDPRLRGAVIVQTHHEGVLLGSLLQHHHLESLLGG